VRPELLEQAGQGEDFRLDLLMERVELGDEFVGDFNSPSSHFKYVSWII
jgi:hypothetical protein